MIAPRYYIRPREFFRALPFSTQPDANAFANACPCSRSLVSPRCWNAMLYAMLLCCCFALSFRRPLQPDFCQSTMAHSLFCPTRQVALIGQECC
jgi:hypothetical protein